MSTIVIMLKWVNLAPLIIRKHMKLRYFYLKLTDDLDTEKLIQTDKLLFFTLQK